MTDPALVLGWVWAAYLALRLVVELVSRSAWVRNGLSSSGGSGGGSGAETARARSARRAWTPLPALFWLAREAAVAAVVVAIAWFVLRDLSINLVPAGLGAAPGDVRRVALAAVLGWSLVVINVPLALRLIGCLLPAEPPRQSGGVDPERMGATIGVIERLLIVVVVPGGGPAAVGFVVAAKTLARFKELDRKRFAERYLLGTMASVTIAVVSVVAAQLVWTSQV